MREYRVSKVKYIDGIPSVAGAPGTASGSASGRPNAPSPAEFYSGFTEFLTAKHTDPIFNEGLHAHRWAVTIFYPAEPLRDGRAMKAGLRQLLDALPDADGVLPPSLWSGEAIAQTVAQLLAGCIGCRVSRPEGFEATVWL